jgi:hypothetical protein
MLKIVFNNVALLVSDPESGPVRCAPAGDLRADPLGPQRPPVAIEVMAAVGLNDPRAPSGPTGLAADRRDRFDSFPARRSWRAGSCSSCQTPASFQSRSRRQQVMPHPNPSSCGSHCQGLPV